MSRIRVAVASADGGVINQSLEDAVRLWIYDVSSEGPKFIELRMVPGAVEREGAANMSLVLETRQSASEQSSHAELPSANRRSRGTALSIGVQDFLDVIADCSVLLVRTLGFESGGKIQLGWVTVYEAPMQVEKALLRFARSALVRNGIL